MKNYFALAVFVLTILLAGCASRSEGGKSSKSVNLEEELTAKEKQVWEAYKAKDATALRELTRDDSYSIEDSNGEIITKAEALSDLPNLTIDEYIMKNIQVTPINRGAAIVRYNVMVKGSSNGTPFTPHWSIVSSIWVEHNGKWQNLSYQETEIQHRH